jgi:hypothetical protein
VSSDETVVRSTCPTCGTVDVPADAVTVLVTGSIEAPTSDPVYRYVCPVCAVVVQKPTASIAVAMLRSAGSTVVVVPAEVTERAPDTRPRLDQDDLGELCRALDGVDDLARLATSPPALRRPAVG